MKHVGHTVDEDTPRFLPGQWGLQALGEQADVIGTGFVTWNAHAPQTWVESEHIAVVATR